MSEKLSSRAFKAIKNDIIHCVLPPGKQYSQSHLMERYEFGIVPIREALQRLVEQDLVQAIPRAGFLISPITLSDVHEIYELRLPLELTAARLCALRADDAYLEALLKDAEFTYQFHDPRSYAAYLARNASFHISIAAGSKNQRLVKLISQMMDNLTRLLYLGLGKKDLGPAMQDEHIYLARVLQGRNVSDVETVVRNQIENSLQIILESIADPSGVDCSLYLSD
jgi:DNA-binding GntR family transcriptional regulator